MPDPTALIETSCNAHIHGHGCFMAIHSTAMRTCHNKTQKSHLCQCLCTSSVKLSSKLFIALPSYCILRMLAPTPPKQPSENHNTGEQHKTCHIDRFYSGALYGPSCKQPPELLYILCVAPVLAGHKLAVNPHGRKEPTVCFYI